MRHVFIVFLLLISQSLAQTISERRSIPDDNLAYPVKIDLSNCINNATPQGSGFVLNTGTEVYLVTARHVLFNAAAQPLALLCKKPQLTSYSRDPKETEQNKYELDLEKLNNDGKVKGHLTRDVAVVQVGVVMGPTAQSGSAFSSLRFLSGINEQARAASGVLTVSMDTLRKFDDVLAANDVYIMG